jgi:hypothetical protein
MMFHTSLLSRSHSYALANRMHRALLPSQLAVLFAAAGK